MCWEQGVFWLCRSLGASEQGRGWLGPSILNFKSFFFCDAQDLNLCGKDEGIGFVHLQGGTPRRPGLTILALPWLAYLSSYSVSCCLICLLFLCSFREVNCMSREGQNYWVELILANGTVLI